MARPTAGELDDVETITLPRGARFPVELDPPPGFDPARTWPPVVTSRRRSTTSSYRPRRST